MMHGVIVCKYQDEVDLWIDKCTDYRVENWARPISLGFQEHPSRRGALPEAVN